MLEAVTSSNPAGYPVGVSGMPLAIFKINFGTEMVQVVPNWWYRWWWSRTRHRVLCGTEMDRYRNRSPYGPEVVWYRTRPTPIK